MDTGNWLDRQLANGRYHLRSKLGEGGMAHVYLADDTQLKRTVVIKTPRLAVLEEPGFSARFLLEVRSLSQLQHSNIVKVIDVGLEDGVPYAVLQYLTGGSLRERLRPQGRRVRQSPDDLRAWLKGIASALDFIHGRGYVHRDVKPDNILFDAHGNAYLSDFGIAKALADGRPPEQRTVVTSTGITLGTPQYMAPELALGNPYDGRIDQYALAVTVYEALSGRCPFDGPTAAAIIVQQTTRPVPPLATVASGVPRRLSEAVGRALSTNAAERFPSCEAFAQLVLDNLGRPGSKPELAPIPEVLPADAVEADPPVVVGARVLVRCPSCTREMSLTGDDHSRRARCPYCRTTFNPRDNRAARQPSPETRPTSNAPTPFSLRPERAPVAPPEGTGGVLWGLLLAFLGLALGGGAGFVLDLFRDALVSRNLGERDSALAWAMVSWGALGVFAVLFGWVRSTGVPRRRRNQLLPVWFVVASVGGALAGWGGVRLGFSQTGPMGLLVGLTVLTGALGVLYGAAAGGTFWRAVGGGLYLACIGEGLAGVLMFLGRGPNDTTFLIVMSSTGAVVGLTWALWGRQLLRLPMPGFIASCLLVLVGIGAMLLFAMANVAVIRSQGVALG